VLLGGAVQGRSPVVPIPVGGSNPVVFLGAQDGNVYAIDASVGGAATPPWLLGPTSIGGVVQAAPAGIFTAFGGAFDYLLVGTRDAAADNTFVAINPGDGSAIQAFDNGGGPGDGIGIINGAATVDYATSLVYFTSRAKAGGSANTLWCLQLGAVPGVFSLVRARGDIGDIDSSPVLRGGRIYVGGTAGGGTLYSIDAATCDPALDRAFVHGDGQVKGFVFPSRSSPTGDVYFATDSRVWVVQDDGSTLAPKYAGGVSLGGGATPSVALNMPGSGFVYVGGSDGKLYQIDVSGASAVLKSVTLGDGSALVGGPSLDRGFNLVHVGTAAGIFYAVQVPLP
jgi:hypothetical protein